VTLHWRRATSSDLPDIMTIAARIHPDLPERMEVYAEKLRLFPDGCRVLTANEEIVGYGIAHPWVLQRIPPLDAFLGQLPADADCLYVHDVAVLPDFRGGGTADAYIATIAALARSARINALALVSVYGTHVLWRRLGFRVAAPDAGLRARLRTYGETAKYMTCDLDART
jgi:GNAT superfamily N-acetyltransferase